MKDWMILAVLSIFDCDVHCSDPHHKYERDNHMLDVLSSLIESSHIAIPLTKQAGKVMKEKNLPGWKQHVEPFRSDAQFWHSIWMSLGRPKQVTSTESCAGRGISFTML